MAVTRKYKQKFIRDAFNRRMILRGGENCAVKIVCHDCYEPIVFALQNNDTTFTVALSTMLQCLQIAEVEELVPKLGDKWWVKIKCLYESGETRFDYKKK